MADFLLELGVEEVPVSDIRSIEEQLREKFQSEFEEQRVEYKEIETTATNKRFMVHISGVAEKAADTEAKVTGPSKEIAYDNKGKPTLALNKFMAAHNAQLKDLHETETKKGIYIALDKKTPGQKTEELLPAILENILQSLLFTKTMVWNESRIPFIRPIKNLLVLFNNRLVPFSYAGVESSNLIHGHHLLSDEYIEINSFKDYIEQLNKNFVLVKENERKEKILTEIKEIEEELKATVPVDDEIMDDYIYGNEYPVVFVGEFDKRYLELPSEIISTFMIKEKKLHPIYDEKNQLMNTFLGVSNIPDENQHVARGNERVIQATFEDAKFFWDNDRKENFTALRKNLKNVLFQKDLGDYYDKTRRLVDYVDFLTEATGQRDIFPDLKEAAQHAKNDLVTRMVREFPSLQGIMGGLYLKESGAKDNVWKAVYGHYLPKGFSKKTTEDVGAALLSLADKIDNIAGFISTGIKTSSSKDPYGIRRDANAIIKLIIDFKLDFDLNHLFQFAADQVSGLELKGDNNRPVSQLEIQIRDFFRSRLENIFKDFLNFRYDLVSAIMTFDSLNIHKLYLRARDVSTILGTDSIAHLIILHKRLRNIIKDYSSFNLSENLLKEPEEKLLFDVFKESKEKIEEHILSDNYLEACSQIAEMKPIIDNFFDNILVMAKDEKVKENRVALLQRIDELLSKVTDFSVLME
jgi:glycyl-tRNA synthetase beta chain